MPAPQPAVPSQGRRGPGSWAWRATTSPLGPSVPSRKSWVSPGELLPSALAFPLPKPLPCLAPTGTAFPQLTTDFWTRAGSSQPSSLLLCLRWLSVVEEITGFGARSLHGRGPAPGRWPVADDGRASLMASKRKANEAGSTNDLRGDVLRVLGVLKVATADQIQRLCSPHLAFRHTLKKTAARRKEARTASHRGAANDLRRHGLSVDGGRTRGGEEVRLLTAAGLAAAAIDLDRAPEEMGGMPKSAGRSGASHPMTVNETVIAMIRPKPDMDLVAGEPAVAVAAAQAAARAPDGIGAITSYATEVALPATGTWKNAGIGSARADVVLVAPEAGVPLLFIEVDNCTEDAALIAAKFDKYMRFFKRKAKDTDGVEKPMWRTRWSAPDPERYERVHPPVLLVFHQVGKRSARTRCRRSPASPAGTGKASGTARMASTPMTAASRSWRPRWSCCASTARPGRRSGASAGLSVSRCWTRSATRAGTPPSPAAAKPPVSRNGATRSRKPRHGRRDGRCAWTADGSSPTTVGRRSTRGTGASLASRTRTCVAAARAGPWQPSSRPRPTNASAGSRRASVRRQRNGPLRRRPAVGSPASAPDPGKPSVGSAGKPKVVLGKPALSVAAGGLHG